MATAPSLPATRNNSPPATTPLSGGMPAIRTAIEELKSIRTFVAEEMRAGLDFGTIPGTGNKNVLLLPGAQKTAMYFNCYSRYRVQRVELGDGHLEVITTTRLISRNSKAIVAEGVGSCSTMETKYRYRKAARQCPACGGEFIIKGKEEYGGGWLCYKAKGGCGAKFPDGDESIEAQAVGQVLNENVHDQRNTVLKMSKKRSLVDAALSLGCMAELFTQDLDDVYDLERPPARAQEAEQAVERPSATQRTKDRPTNGTRRQPPPREPEPETWASWIVRELGDRNTAFLNEQGIAGVAQEQRVKEVMNQFEAANLVASACIYQGIVKKEALAQSADPSKYDRSKVLKFVADYFRQYPEWVKDTVIERYREKQDDLARRLRVYNPDAEPADETEEADASIPY